MSASGPDGPAKKVIDGKVAAAKEVSEVLTASSLRPHGLAGLSVKSAFSHENVSGKPIDFGGGTMLNCTSAVHGVIKASITTEIFI